MRSRQWQRFKAGLQRKQLSNLDRIRVVAAYRAGSRSVDIARQFGIHRATVWRISRVLTKRKR
ncbi:helix-turn-helix domain-containing protein [Pirellula sp. SH-Sr6A]|uniref:helix-turn-helix domain-containing protein n=1 Tax=Pirellula sp. SH-Sr6A TaxID=1632865 RepID=UPI00143CB0EF